METVEELIHSMDLYISSAEENISKLEYHTATIPYQPKNNLAVETGQCENGCRLLKMRYSYVSVKFEDCQSFVVRLEKEIQILHQEVASMDSKIKNLETELIFVKEERNDALEKLRVARQSKKNDSEDSQASKQFMKKLTVRGTKIDIHFTPLTLKEEPHFETSPNIESNELHRGVVDQSNMEDKFVHMKLKFAEKCEDFMKMEDDLFSAKHTIVRLSELLKERDESINNYKILISSIEELNKLKQLSTFRSNTDTLHILDSTGYSSNINSKTSGNEKKGEYANLLNSIKDEVIGVSDSLQLNKQLKDENQQSYRPTIKFEKSTNMNYGLTAALQPKAEVNLTSCLLGNVMKTNSNHQTQVNSYQGASKLQKKDDVQPAIQLIKKESCQTVDSQSSSSQNKCKVKAKEEKSKKSKSILTLFKKLI